MRSGSGGSSASVILGRAHSASPINKRKTARIKLSKRRQGGGYGFRARHCVAPRNDRLLARLLPFLRLIPQRIHLGERPLRGRLAGRREPFLDRRKPPLDLEIARAQCRLG